MEPNFWHIGLVHDEFAFRLVFIFTDLKNSQHSQSHGWFATSCSPHDSNLLLFLDVEGDVFDHEGQVGLISIADVLHWDWPFSEPVFFGLGFGEWFFRRVVENPVVDPVDVEEDFAHPQFALEEPGNHGAHPDWVVDGEGDHDFLVRGEWFGPGGKVPDDEEGNGGDNDVRSNAHEQAEEGASEVVNVHPKVEDVLVEIHLTFLILIISLEGPNYAGSSDCFLKEAWPFFMLLIEIIDDVVGGFPNAEVQFIEDNKKNDDQHQIHWSLIDYHQHRNGKTWDQAKWPVQGPNYLVVNSVLIFDGPI